MKYLFFFLVIFSLNVLGQDLRHTVVLKSKPKAIKILGVTIKEVIVTGTQQEIMDALIGPKAWINDPSCSNLLLSKQQIFESLAKTDEHPNCRNNPGVCAMLPNAYDFMGVYQNQKWKNESCKIESVCLNKDGAELTISCGDFSLTLSTSGQIQLTAKEGKLSRAVAFGENE
jgi:hypothetical protein